MRQHQNHTPNQRLNLLPSTFSCRPDEFSGLDQAEINVENAQKALTFIDETKQTSALPALIVFLGANVETRKKTIKLIRQALTSQDHLKIFDAVQAIKKWLECNQISEGQNSFPRNLVQAVLKALFRAPNLGLSTLIECAQSLVQSDQFSASEIDELIEMLEDLLGILDYSQIKLDDPKGIDAPMARLQCMVLSKILLQKGSEYPVLHSWVNLQSSDPLPEIRNVSLEKLCKEPV